MADEVEVDVLPNCDIHQIDKGTTVSAYYDGKTRQGPWANMCESCFRTHGIGLGLGRGQRLLLRKSRGHKSL